MMINVFNTLLQPALNFEEIEKKSQIEKLKTHRDTMIGKDSIKIIQNLF